MRNTKKIFHALAGTIALATLFLAVIPGMATSHGPTVKVLGGNTVRINQRLVSTYHFGPGHLKVGSATTITFDNTGPCAIDCDHTVSIVNAAQLPSSIVEVFSCLIDAPGTVCATVGSAHFPQGPGGPVHPVANVTGEPSGFLGGNSFVLAHGQTLDLTVTAPAGTTFHYMCAIHPWMQGSITVGQGESESESD